MGESQASVRILSSEQRAEAARHWRALEAATELPLACSWDWTSTWLEHYGAGVAHRFAVVERAGAPIAIALVTLELVRRRGVPVRRLHLGTAGEPAGATVFVERNAIAARLEDRSAAATALAGWLRDERGFDELRLDGFLVEDAEFLARALPGLTLHREPSPRLDLSAARERGDNVLAALRSGPRRRVRQSLKAFGRLHLTWASDDEAARRTLDELIELHQRRWTAAGERGAFADVRVRSFHHDLVARLLRRNLVVLCRVATEDDQTVGCLLSYVDRGRVLFYQAGLERFEQTHKRPGLASHALVMQACLDRGFDTYDFLAGGARYKHELSDGADDLVWARTYARTLRAGALSLAARLRQRSAIER